MTNPNTNPLAGKGMIQNPQFIYPGGTNDMYYVNRSDPNNPLQVTRTDYPVKRGYVRRLLEFYSNKSNGTATDASSLLRNMKCNFQFNPELLTRNIQSDTSMQLFFNQEPNQLTQPVPGKATFAFELLFNREAEMNSGKYLAGNVLTQGRKTKKNASTRNGAGEIDKNYYIDNAYDPSWVTEIGVLADIMVLDDLLGVGLAKDVSAAITGQQLKTTVLKTTSVDPLKPEEPAKEKTVYDQDRIASFSANLGNKAFLVPQPIRVVFSDWMMVEGFVTGTQVDFNKFTNGYIPTMCRVSVQMQALYIGFTQQKTFLTQMPMADPDNGADGIEVIDIKTPEGKTRQDTIDGMKDFIKDVAWREGSSGGVRLNKMITEKERTKVMNFAGSLSKNGLVFYDQVGAGKTAASGLALTFSGTIKVWWNSHITNATNQRKVEGCAAEFGGVTPIVKKGPPDDTTTETYSQYGTKDEPLIISVTDHPALLARGETGGSIIYGKIKTGFGFTGNQYRGEDAVWTWAIPNELSARPFDQDQFNIELEITTYCVRSTLAAVELPQKIRMLGIIPYSGEIFPRQLTIASK